MKVYPWRSNIIGSMATFRQVMRQSCAAAVCSAFLLLLCPSESIADEGLKVEKVRVQSMEAKAFFRIAEYFTGREHFGKRVILRSDPEQRAGIYFVVYLNRKLEKLPSGTLFELEFLQPGTSRLRRQDFVLPEIRKSTDVVFLGLTDSEQAERGLPVAWRIRVGKADGEKFAEYKSYLWELPQEESRGRQGVASLE